MTEQAGFRECYPMAIRLYEDVRQLVLGIILSAWIQRHKKIYVIIIKP